MISDVPEGWPERQCKFRRGRPSRELKVRVNRIDLSDRSNPTVMAKTHDPRCLTKTQKRQVG